MGSRALGPGETTNDGKQKRVSRRAILSLKVLIYCIPDLPHQYITKSLRNTISPDSINQLICELGYDAQVTAASLHRSEEIRVTCCGGSDNFAASSDNIISYNILHGESIFGSEVMNTTPNGQPRNSRWF